MPAIINKIEVDVSCEQCRTCTRLKGVIKTACTWTTGVNSWAYIDIATFPSDWKRYGQTEIGNDVTEQEFYCPLHDKPAPKKIGRPKKVILLGGK